MPESGVVDTNVPLQPVQLMAQPARAFVAQHATELAQVGADPALLLDRMDRDGVSQAWLTGYCAKDVMGFGWEANEWLARYVEADPKRLLAIGGYDPRHDGNGEEAVGRLRGLGMKALMVHPAHQHLRPNGPRLRPALSACQRAGMPVLLHAGGSPYPGAAARFGDPALASRVCATFPRMQVVLMHDGNAPVEPAVQALREHPNAWLAISGPGASQIAKVPDVAKLAQRLLWGSAWPGPGAAGMRQGVDGVKSLGLSPAAEQQVLAGNAQRLMAD